jgi:integrase
MGRRAVTRRLEVEFRGRRATLALAINEAAMRQLRVRLGELRSMREANLDPGPELAAWIAGLGDRMHAVIADVGLVPARRPRVGLLEFVARAIDRPVRGGLAPSGRDAGLSPKTVAAERGVGMALESWLRAQGREAMLVEELDGQDGEAILMGFVADLRAGRVGLGRGPAAGIGGPGLSEASLRLVGRVVHRWMGVAHRCRMIERVPSAVLAKSSITSAESAIVTTEMVWRLINAAVPHRRQLIRGKGGSGGAGGGGGAGVGRVLSEHEPGGVWCGSVSAARAVALVAFGGLRAPSELVRLTWGSIVLVGQARDGQPDVQLEGQPEGGRDGRPGVMAMRVYAPKTRSERLVPVMPELGRVLFDRRSPVCRAALEDDRVRIVAGVGGGGGGGGAGGAGGAGSGRNLSRDVAIAVRRAEADAAAEGASFARWPRLFDTLREHAENMWRRMGVRSDIRARIMGHGEGVAVRHYERVGDDEIADVARMGALARVEDDGGAGEGGGGGGWVGRRLGPPTRSGALRG